MENTHIPYVVEGMTWFDIYDLILTIPNTIVN